MTDLSSNTAPNASSHARHGPGANSENGSRSALIPPVAGDGIPPRVRETHKPEILGFIKKLPLDVKLKFNTEIESRNRERAERRWEWYRNPQGDEPVSDDESVITISEDDLDRLSDPIIFDSLSTTMPFFVKGKISSRKRRRESGAGVKSSHKSDDPADKRPRVDGPFLKSQTPMNATGFFNDAHDLILYQPVMNSINEAKDKVLQWLAKFTMSGAEFDARGHVPSCHPGTRIAILERLKGQIDDTQRTRRMLWLRGPAGVGKSAILQSLAEQLSETSKLGATLFFSRPNGRHNPDFVIPTIAYQLAVRIPPYKEHVRQVMVNDPRLLEKDMERQFQTLIIEPITKLGLTAEDNRWVILLDGLDECEGENAQALIVNLISRFTRHHPTSPLVWVIASRPEAHLKVLFNSEGVRGSFEEHEVLVSSNHACRDVEEFLRAKFGEIRKNYADLIPTGVPWPAEQDITRISRTSSGLFALAATIVHYVGDPDACDPVSQLATVLSRTEGLEPGSLSTLYALYSTILDGVPKFLSPILKLAFPFYTARGKLLLHILRGTRTTEPCPLVLFATIFGLQQHAVYGALRKLHSVIEVPSLSKSGHLGIRFYHASFSDYLKTLGDYTISVDMMRNIGGDHLQSYMGEIQQVNAVSGGRPPVPLSWDVELHDKILEMLWLNEMRRLLHLLLPQCPDPDECGFDHRHLFSDAEERQRTLEKIDFSALISDSTWSSGIFENIFYLFRWLVSAEPAELSRSDVVRKMSVGNLDLTCVSKTKLSGVGLWSDNRTWTEGLPFNRYRIYGSRGIDELVSKLDQLQSENPMIDVLVVGERPSKRCVLMCTAPLDKEEGSFYYIPYCG